MRKAQVTLFVILAIVIVTAGILFAYFEGKKEADGQENYNWAQKGLGWYRVNGEKRDHIFSDKLEELLRDGKTRDVLCFI